MIVGHYAAALLPYSRLKERAPFWLLLLSANVPEFLWLLLALLGIEAPVPGSMLHATFENLQVDMVYSHNLAPTVLQAVVVGAVVWAWRRDLAVAGVCAGLVILHTLCDYIVGFQHQVLGRDSFALGLNSYARFPHAAIGIELLFALGCIAWYQVAEAKKGRPLPRKQLIALYAVFAVGILAWMPTATKPLSAVLP